MTLLERDQTISSKDVPMTDIIIMEDTRTTYPKIILFTYEPFET
jgi:hypothetical protein